MALINLGTSPNTATGDTLYDAFTKINLIVGNGNGDIESCTATGKGAMSAVNTGAYNTANGFYALSANTSGSYNTALGYGASINSVTTNRNTAIGSGALALNTAGNNNTAIGDSALYNNTTAGNNTAIGKDALNVNTTYFNISGVGYNSQITNSNQVQLGDSSTTPYAYQALSLRSDLRDKAEIRDTVLGLDFINELRPVDYKWDMREDYKSKMPLNEDEIPAWLESVRLGNINHDGTHIRSRYHHGLIAQEVKEVINTSGVDFGGFQDHSVSGGEDVLSIGYDELIAPMIKAIQELTARINVLEGN